MASILILTQGYVPDPSTTGQHLHDAAVMLVARGHSVRVLAATRGYNNPAIKYPLRERRDGVEIRRIPLGSFGKGRLVARVASALLLAAQSVMRGLLVRKPDVILVSTHPPLAPVSALVLSRLRGIPICYWVHDLNPDLAVEMGLLRGDGPAARLMNRLNRRILDRATRIVVLDRFMAERVRRKRQTAASKIAVLPPWPHNDCEERIRHADNPWRRAHIGEGRITVMYSGGYTPAHSLDTVLQAALRLRNDETIEFLFIGEGAGKREIEATIERERPRNIRSMPFQPLETLRYSLSAADVHVVAVGDGTVGLSHPSKIYGAMAAGRPLLLFGPSSCHATDIMHDHDIGWRVAHGDVAGALDVLERIRRTPREHLDRMGRTAQDLVRRHYGRDRLRARFCDEVEAVL